MLLFVTQESSEGFTDFDQSAKVDTLFHIPKILGLFLRAFTLRAGISGEVQFYTILNGS